MPRSEAQKLADKNYRERNKEKLAASWKKISVDAELFEEFSAIAQNEGLSNVGFLRKVLDFYKISK